MNTFLMPPGRARGWTNAGVPAAGCLLYTYEAGTTTPKATYTDAAGLVPHTNPIVLDAKGEALIYWDGNYKVDLKTAGGVQITGYPIDDFETPLMPGTLSAQTGSGLIGFLYAAVYGAGSIGKWLQDLATSAGAGLIGFLQTGTGAVLQTLQQRMRADRVNIFDFLSNAKRVTLMAGTQTDVTVELQTALDSFTTYGTVEIFGNMKITSTIYLKRTGMRLVGRGIGNTFVEFVNAAGGTALSGAVSNMATITDCEYSGFSLAGTAAGTSASIGVDITTMAYSRIDLSIQTRRVGGVCIFGEGNNGSSPYYNEIKGYLFGGSDYSQEGIKFAGGVWAGGSNGPNANTIGPISRAASLGTMINLESGNGNTFNSINGESIGDYYFKLNSNAAVATGTSSGSNTMSSLKDTTKTWTVNEYLNHAVKITSGTGSGQVRRVKNNTATSLGVDNPWGVLPDATSVYAIYKSNANSNKIVNCRAEGLSTLNPDFIYAAPGTFSTSVLNTTVDSLGSGLVVRDDSGNPSNTWFDGHKVIFTHSITNPGASYNQDIYPRNSVYGGVLLTNFVIEWMSVSINGATPGGTATAKLDVGGTATGNGDMTMTVAVPNVDAGFAMPASTEKIKRDGQNKHVFINVATDASFDATSDITVTWCATIDT